MNILKIIPNIINAIRKFPPKKGAALSASGIGSIVAIETALPAPTNDIEMILKYSIEFVSALTALFGALATFIHEVKEVKEVKESKLDGKDND